MNPAVSLLVVFLAGEVRSSLDSHCTDISYYDALQYTTSAKQCCKPRLKEFCENKREEVCKDVVEVQCEPKARVECRTETSFAEGKKCDVELQHYDYKDCNKKVTTRIDCKLETVQSCKPKIKLAQDGSPTFNGDLSCTPLSYEKCVIVDDAVSGCSRQELDHLCACDDEVSSPVCAGGLLYDNQCKYECKKKRDQCAFTSREFPAVEDIKECFSQDAKGIVNRDKIKEFKEVLSDIEDELEKLANRRSRRDISQFSHAEYELLNSLVQAKDYVRDYCSNENGQCDLTKLQTLIEKSKSTFKEVKESGTVSPGYVQTFTREKEQFEEVAVVAEKVQEKLAAKPKQPVCTCSDFTNSNGIGKCQHHVKIGDTIAFGGQVACYVNLPTSCSDVIESETNPGKYLSAEACSCSNVNPNNPLAYEACGHVQIGRRGSNRFENVHLPGRAASTEVADSPTCTTPFQVKWADYTETAKAMTTQETVCEVKKSVECKKVSVNKCTKLEWRECSWRPVQQCEAVFVSEPSQEKVHRKKCLNTGADSGLLSGPLSLSLSFPEDSSAMAPYDTSYAMLAANVNLKYFNRKNRQLGTSWDKGGESISFSGSKLGIEDENSFMPDIKTVFISHGYHSSASVPDQCDNWVLNYLKSGQDVQVVCIDWRHLAQMGFWTDLFYCGGEYNCEAKNSVDVGWWLGHLLHSLVENTGLNVDKVQLIGHSLGAHVVGNMGRTFRSLSGKKVARVTGLDPAGPLFVQDNYGLHKYEIGKDSGAFVDIIHSNGDFNPHAISITHPGSSAHFGDLHALGHADFYPNGGRNQGASGCDISYGVCSHTRAVVYYLHSILGDPTSFKSYECASAETCSLGEKTSDEVANHMGEYAVKQGGDAHKQYLYYLEVTSTQLFS